MIDDRNPNFARGFQISSAQLGDLRRKWGEAGRQVYADAIRTGRNVMARTEAEIEALGRAHVQQAELQQAQARAVAQATAGGVRRTAKAVSQQVQAAGAAQANADSLRHAQEESLRRTATSVARTAAHVMRPGTPSDPGPVRLYGEWATGVGPERRMLGPESSMSREFVQAPSVQGYLRQHIADWRRRDGGVSGTYVRPHARRANFGEGEFLMDLDAGNGASHFVGSWDATAERQGDQIDWTVENDTDLTSFGAGRILRKSGLPFWRSYSRPWPGGRTHQTMHFSTDLNGRPLLPD